LLSVGPSTIPLAALGREAFERGLGELGWTTGETIRVVYRYAEGKYGADLVAVHRRSAFYVDRLLRGARPVDLPIEEPSKFVLAVNLKTARAIGLTLPSSLLGRADEIIQ
jgi:hypothetical protein